MATMYPRPWSSGQKQECLALACGESVIIGTVVTSLEVASDNTVTVQQLAVDGSPVVCLSFSPSGLFLAACSDGKECKVWDAVTWQVLGKRTIPKRATVLQFTNDDKYVLIADKTGEVTSYEVSNLAGEGKLLLGHLSMLLDMVLSPSNSHVITCDRDEKIRVSKYPNSYNIETFCLGHTEFVSAICILDKWHDILLSGSGDGTLKSWKWLRGELLHTQECSANNETKASLPVTHLACSHCLETTDVNVVVALESSPDLLTFLLNSDGKLVPNPNGALSLATPPWSCAFDWSNHLWVCLPNEQEPLQCYRLENGTFSKCDHPLLEMCKWDYFKGCVGKGRDWTQLRKHTVDNMSAYLTRKEERVRSKMAAGGEQEPQPKIPKLDCTEEALQTKR